MIQHLENFYLATLRFVVILIASLLLIAVIVLGWKATSVLHPAPAPIKQAPVVSQVELKKAVLMAENAPESAAPISGSSTSDPDQMYYDRTGLAVKRFFDQHFPGAYNIDQKRIAGLVKERADAYPTAELTDAYAKNLASNVETLLSDRDLIALTKSNEPGPVIERILSSFSDEFDRQVKSTNADNESMQDKYLSEQTAAQRSLYTAAIAFGAFLLIVFLSIIIRIERNLRPEHRPAV
jgi:hypothetical protein